MRPAATDTKYCGQCGAPIAVDTPTIERFGERFCAARHAEEFADAVRASRVAQAANGESSPAICHLGSSAQRSWKDRLKRSACWAAPLLVLVALPLFWSGNALAATGGSVLSLLAVLACPLAMFFMMRAMMPTQHHDARGDNATGNGAHAKEDRHA
jgi:hypothetical protein